jgi:hypothetical protein
MSQRGNKRSSVAKSFYLDNATIKKLVEQSEQEGISVNSLVSKVLKEHVELRHPAKKSCSSRTGRRKVRKYSVRPY